MMTESPDTSEAMHVVGRPKTYSFVFRKSVCRLATIPPVPAEHTSRLIGSTRPDRYSFHRPVPSRDLNASNRHGNRPLCIALAIHFLRVGASGLFSRGHCDPGNACGHLPGNRYSGRHRDLAV